MNDNSLDLGELRRAWSALDRKLERQSALVFQQHKERRLAKARWSLYPLYVAGVVQLVCGLAIAVAAGSFWTAHRAEPYHLAAGLILHAYGVLVAGFAVHELVLARRVDFAAPVLDIQRRLAQLRDLRAGSAPWLGLPWWILWLLAITSLLRSLTPRDLFSPLPDWVLWNLIVGSLGLVGSATFVFWARRRPELRRKLESTAAGWFVGRAQAYVAEVEQFARDES